MAERRVVDVDEAHSLIFEDPRSEGGLFSSEESGLDAALAGNFSTDSDDVF